ncbi:rpmE2 product [Alishewanella aestuarii B11]|uniref:50S ribosomal protein L31 n=2 Tax=Alishewanella aestuarii TaxID=453835 RepID=J1YFW8_9ALTE|nr:rpmE2 product [Alishewanella aestuarii B11]
MAVDTFFLVGSTIKTTRTHTWTDGKTYPYVTLDISSASHPYYTGKQKQVSNEGRSANFDKKFGRYVKGGTK